MVLGNKDRKRIAWIESFKSGEKWFLKLAKQYGDKEGTRKNYAMALERFCEYMKMTPEEIIAAYTKALDQNVRKAVEEWNDNLDLFVPWAIKRYGLSRSRARDHFSAVKSFFDNNVAIKLTAKTPEAYSKERLPVSIDDIREKILPHADMQETFIILFLKDSGVSQAEALRFNVGNVKDLKNGFGYMRVFRKKEGVDYETFIGPNAMKAMQQYIDFRKRQGENVTDDSPLFVKKAKLGERLARGLISTQLTALGKKAGVELSTHRLRKCFETYLALGKVHPIILKYWMGHKVKRGRDIEAKYIIPPTPKQKEAYMEAYKHIDVTPKPDETEVLLAEMRTRMEALPPEHRQRFLKEITTAYRSRAHIIRSDKRIQELLKEFTDCPDGKNCLVFKEVNESDLLNHLKEGWRIIHHLQNGKVIIQKD